MGKSSRSAWGTLAQVDETTWRIRYWSAGPDGYRRRSCTVRGTRRDAERKRAELMLAHSEDAPCPTVGEVWERWYLPSQQRRVEDGSMSRQTLAVYMSAWRNHAEPRWGSVPCDAVRPLHVQQWLDGMPYSAADAAMKLLRPMLDYAVRYDAIGTNPFRERYLMPSKRDRRSRDAGVWTLDELGEVWQAVHGEWLEAAFILAAFGGLRVGESLGVRSEDVGEVTVRGVRVALVEVRRQVQNHGGRVTERLKNAQSRRVVAIPGRAADRLIAIAEREHGWLSGDGLGEHNSQKRLMRSWSDAMQRLPVRLRHPFRNLRNSWQTNMRWTLRVPPYYIEPMMGHLVEGVTGSYYDRPQAELFADVMADAYVGCPYDAAWSWTVWDDLGRKNFMH